MTIRILTIAFLLAACSAAYSQNRKLEISVNGSKALLHADESPFTHKLDLTGFGIEAMYFLTDHVGVGGLFYHYPALFNDGGTLSMPGGTTGPARAHLWSEGRMFGGKATATTNRDRTIRAYASGRFMFLQLREESQGGEFAIYNDGICYSAGVGIALKISHLLSLNLFEANYLVTSKTLSYSDADILAGLTINAGLTFKFLRTK